MAITLNSTNITSNKLNSSDITLETLNGSTVYQPSANRIWVYIEEVSSDPGNTYQTEYTSSTADRELTTITQLNAVYPPNNYPLWSSGQVYFSYYGSWGVAQIQNA